MVIRPERLKPLEKRLMEMGVDGITVTKCKGYGEEAKYLFEPHFLPHAKVEIILPDDEVRGVIDAVISTVKTGSPGDGILAVLPVEDVVKIRTGESGEGVIKGNKKTKKEDLK
jgi:nitrogen regulatory protein P-II 1